MKPNNSGVWTKLARSLAPKYGEMEKRAVVETEKEKVAHGTITENVQKEIGNAKKERTEGDKPKR